jgi:hypothetical protein
VVAEEGGERFTVPLVPQARFSPGVASGNEPRVEERPRRQVGRLPRFGVERVPVDTRELPASEQLAESSGGEPGLDPAEPPTISLAEVEARLADRIEVPEAELQALGEARAQAVRGWLLGAGRVSAERVLLSPVSPVGARANLTLR